MRRVWLVFGCMVVFGGSSSMGSGCWVTRGEIRDKIHEIDDSGATGDTGEDNER